MTGGYKKRAMMRQFRTRMKTHGRMDSIYIAIKNGRNDNQVVGYHE